MFTPRKTSQSKPSVVLSQCRDALIAILAKTLCEYFRLADDRLFQLSEEYPGQHHRFFDAMCQFRRDRKTLQDAFIEGLRDQMGAFIRSPEQFCTAGIPEQRSAQPVMTFTQSDMTLLDRQRLMQVHLATLILSGQETLIWVENPFCPPFIKQVFHAELVNVVRDLAVATVLTQDFSEFLDARIEVLYVDLVKLTD